MIARPTSNAAIVAITGTAIFNAEPGVHLGVRPGSGTGGIASVVERLSM
jgi:hypothetical protein